jgi:tRNA pseudouridine-54 N-methylase
LVDDKSFDELFCRVVEAPLLLLVEAGDDIVKTQLESDKVINIISVFFAKYGV